uniref:Uncharacterized protein n=1 Tax=Anopheles coluzzii TaxID=1518534 RepID=A0A6E8W6V6_ANOCL
MGSRSSDKTSPMQASDAPTTPPPGPAAVPVMPNAPGDASRGPTSAMQTPTGTAATTPLVSALQQTAQKDAAIEQQASSEPSQEQTPQRSAQSAAGMQQAARADDAPVNNFSFSPSITIDNFSISFIIVPPLRGLRRAGQWCSSMKNAFLRAFNRR